MAELNKSKMAREIADMALDESDYKGKSIRQWADLIASGDAVQVVRCKDCGYVGKNTWADGSIFCAGNKQEPNNYCSRGVRKDGTQ